MLIIQRSISFSVLRVVVSCAGDGDLAKRLYDFLISAYPSAADTNMISLKQDEITVEIGKPGINKDEVRQSSIKFQGSTADLVGYSVREYEDVFTVGIPHSLDEVILSCEMCGYLAQHEEELVIHKKIHWPIPTY